MHIRSAIQSDIPQIKAVIEDAFPKQESEQISILSEQLITSTLKWPITSLVAEKNNKILGFVMFSPVYMRDNCRLLGFLLSPLAILSSHQKMGLGSSIVKAGMDVLKQHGTDILLVYGDPKYYGRFGFDEKIAKSFIPPYTLKYPFGWLGVCLNGSLSVKSEVKFDCVEPFMLPELW